MTHRGANINAGIGYSVKRSGSVLPAMLDIAAILELLINEASAKKNFPEESSKRRLIKIRIVCILESQLPVNEL